MTLKANWKHYIQNLKKKEIQLLHPYLSERQIVNGLEIGAGNGFQSRILSKYIDYLYCTELNETRLNRCENNKISYRICDAEKINDYFDSCYFDLIFSSNLLEHLPSPDLAIRGSGKILKDNGIMIHIIPSSFIATIRILLWYPNLAISLIENMLSKSSKNNDKETSLSPELVLNKSGNNLKLFSKQKSNLNKIIVPRPHGVSNNIFQEVMAFRKRRWVKEFNNQGFNVLKILKGPVCSGYGFGLNSVRHLLEYLGFASEYIYIIKK